MAPLSIIHHAAHRDDHAYPASSLPAVSPCLAANARVIEVDIAPMAGDDFLLAHDDDLAHFTTGQGLARKLTVEQVNDSRLISGRRLGSGLPDRDGFRRGLGWEQQLEEPARGRSHRSRLQLDHRNGDALLSVLCAVSPERLHR